MAALPTKFAYATRNLQDLSGGRFVLGIGTQVPLGRAEDHASPCARRSLESIYHRLQT